MNMINLIYTIEISIFIAVCTLGVVQLLKNFFNTNGKKKRVAAVVSTIVSVGMSIVNTDIVPLSVTVMVDIIMMSVAITQLAWDVLAKAVPEAVSAFIDKAIGKAAAVEKKDEESCEE